MAKPSVALRLGLEGEETITNGFDRIVASGDTAAKRLVNDFQRAGQDIDRALGQQAVAAQKLRIVTGKDVQSGENQNAQVLAFRAYRQEMELQARQAAALRDLINPLAVAQRRYDEEIETANRLLRANLLTEGEHAEAVRRSTRALEAARVENTKGAANDNARRASLQNLGFQAQDFAVQVVGGTSALRALAQQAPQAIGALAGLGGQVEGTATKFQRFIGFLGGPWGIALTVAGTVVLGLADKLLSSGDAGDAGKAGLERYSNSLDDLKRRAQEADKAIQSLNISAGQRRVNDIGDLRRDRLLAEGRLAQALAGAQAPTRPVYGIDTTAAIQAAAQRAKEVQDIRDLIAVQDLQIRIRERADASIRAEEAAARQATETRKGEIATSRASAAAHRAEAGARREVVEAAYEQGRLNITLGSSPQLPNGTAELASITDRIDQERAGRKELADWEENYQRSRISSLAGFYRQAFTGAGQSIGQALKSALLDAVTTALARMTINKVGGLLDSAGGFLKSLGIGRPAANAAGTNYFTGGMTWVAENGPELISLPRGSRVTNAADTRRLMSAANDRGGGITVVVNANDAVLADTVRGWVAQGIDIAAVRGAAGGSQMAQAEMTASGERRLGRSWR